jgi:hypothetical protein
MASWLAFQGIPSPVSILNPSPGDHNRGKAKPSEVRWERSGTNPTA